MKFRKISTALALAGVLAAAPGCKEFFNVNVDPISPRAVNLRDILPVTQVTMAAGLGNNTNGLSQYTMALMQQLYNSRGIGNFLQTGDSFTNSWSTLYSDMLVNNEQIINQGTAEQQWGYVGIAQLQKAYVFSQIVDVWGDVPYSEALRGADKTVVRYDAPRFDKDVEIYNGSADGTVKGLFALIDEGLANLLKASSRNSELTTVDLIYRGSLVKWGRFGRTLKLKLYNQLRKTNPDATVSAQITPLLGGDLITELDDFELPYSSGINPDNRNLGYIADYGNSSPENRIGRYFYEDMVAKNDPRVRYYFFLQVAPGTAVTGVDYVGLGVNSRFVTVRPGSTGQFASAVSSTVATVQGLYPVGGRFDTGTGGQVGVAANRASGKGAVAQRLLTYFSRKYTEAELQLTVLNNSAVAETRLREALQASFNKVNAIALADGSPLISPAAINTYITAAIDRYNFKPVGIPRIPTTAAEKLEVIMKEKYVASFGYGVDVWTDFRRTKYPNINVSQQAADPARGLLPDDGGTVSQGVFPRRFYYPTNDLLLNPNSPRVQKDLNSPIFWER